jgi:addiction module RelE/StbE family toxin
MKSEPRIEYASLFTKQRQAAPSEIKQAFVDALALFLLNPEHTALRNHPLRDKFAGFRSIDVTENWRAVFREERIGDRTLIKFYQLGTHQVLYG